MSGTVMERVDALVAKGGRFMPRWGWHDDHRDKDGTPEYLPALQQVRDEFMALTTVLGGIRLPAREGDGGITRVGTSIFDGRALQLGVGEIDASHWVWMSLFQYEGVLTIDWSGCRWGAATYPGADTHSMAAVDMARRYGLYDFLFIDAGHLEADVRADYQTYAPLVRKGGVIAFHDSLPREGYPELGVRSFLETLEEADVHYIGTEVGVAWVIR